MGNFNDRGNRGGFRGGNGGGRPDFKRGGFGGGNRGGERREVSMHKAICDECQKSCEVPFRPSSDKPIYCDNCFKDKRGNEAPRREFNDRGPKKDFGNKPNFSKPTGSNDDLKKQLNEMNSKLDRLVSAIEKMSATKVVTPTVVASKPAVKASAVAVKKVEVKKSPAKVAPKKVVAKAPTKKVEVKKVVIKKKK